MQTQTLNPNDTLDGSRPKPKHRTAADLEAQLAEARAERDDLAADLPTLDFGREADEARHSRDLNRAADLQCQQQVFENLARGQREDIDTLALEIEGLEAALKREEIRQQLISAARTATEAHEQVDRQIAELGAEILPHLRGLVSTLDHLREAQYSFDRGCSALGMPRRAFNTTNEASQQLEGFVLGLELFTTGTGKTTPSHRHPTRRPASSTLW